MKLTGSPGQVSMIANGPIAWPYRTFYIHTVLSKDLGFLRQLYSAD